MPTSRPSHSRLLCLCSSGCDPVLRAAAIAAATQGGAVLIVEDTPPVPMITDLLRAMIGTTYSTGPSPADMIGVEHSTSYPRKFEREFTPEMQRRLSQAGTRAEESILAAAAAKRARQAARRKPISP